MQHQVQPCYNSPLQKKEKTSRRTNFQLHSIPGGNLFPSASNFLQIAQQCACFTYDLSSREMKCAAASTSTPGVHCVIVHMITNTPTQITTKKQNSNDLTHHDSTIQNFGCNFNLISFWVHLKFKAWKNISQSPTSHSRSLFFFFFKAWIRS